MPARQLNPEMNTLKQGDGGWYASLQILLYAKIKKAANMILDLGILAEHPMD